MHRTAGFASLALALALAPIGCSSQPSIDYSQLKLARVSGRVTLNGEPLAGASVEMEIAGVLPVLASYAKTDADGRYEMVYDSEQKGVTPGQKVVRIYGGAPVEGIDSDAGPVPARYNKESDLRITVEPNGQHTFDFPLET